MCNGEFMLQKMPLPKSSQAKANDSHPIDLASPASTEQSAVLQEAAHKQVMTEAKLEIIAAAKPNPVWGDQTLFHKGIESILDIAIYMIDTQGIVRTWSPSAAKIKGFSKEEILGQHYSKFYLDEEVKGGFLEKEMQIAREIGHFENQGWRQRSDGTKFWADEIITPIYDNSDKKCLLGYCKTTRDLSSLKHTEEMLVSRNETLETHLQQQVAELTAMNTRLQQSEERYRKLLQVSQSVIWSVDPIGRMLSLQTSWEQFTGQSFPHYREYGWLSVIHPQDRDRLWQTWQHAARTVTPYQGCYRIWSHAAGHYRYVMANAAPLVNQLNQVYEWIGSCVDVHDLRQSEEMLRNLQANMDLALQASGIGTWRLDILNNTVIWDERMYQIFGLAPYNFIPTYAAFLERIHPEDRQIVAETTLSSVRNGTDYYLTYRIVLPDNTIRNVSVKAKIYYDINHMPYQLTGVCWDVTEQKCLEAERLAAITHAESIQRERAEELEKLHNRLQEILHMLLHEVRGPLTGIQGVLEWLKDAQSQLSEILRHLPSASTSPTKSTSTSENIATIADFREGLANIHKTITDIIEINTECVGYLNDITTNMLEQAKLDAGKIQLNCVVFDPEYIISAIARMQRGNKYLIERLLKINVETPKEEILVKGDSAKLKVALLNFVSNAIKFTHKGEVNIILKYRILIERQTELHISISDTGIGMTEDEQKELFQKFTQVGARFKRPSGGSGLGLCIAKGYIEAMGGKITVTSKKDNGTTFDIILPCQNPTAEEKLAYKQQLIAQHASEKLLHAETSLHKKRVLIVEDNIVNQTILRRVMEKYHYEYHIAKDGHEALDALNSKQYFDIVLMDIQMPNLDGIATTREIRKREQEVSAQKPLPVIGLSAYTNAEDKDNAIEAGMNDYITKPYKSEDILAKILYWTNQNLHLKPHTVINALSPSDNIRFFQSQQQQPTTLSMPMKDSASSSEVRERPSKESPSKKKKQSHKEEGKPNGLTPF
jgi:PAS domain S-box-containing protein